MTVPAYAAPGAPRAGVGYSVAEPIATPAAVEAARKAREEEYGEWIANGTILSPDGSFVSYGDGAPVPKGNVEAFGYEQDDKVLRRHSKEGRARLVLLGIITQEQADEESKAESGSARAAAKKSADSQSTKDSGGSE